MVDYRHRDLCNSDVFLASYPKSGNTWLRHLLAYVVTQESTPWRGGIDKVSDLVGRHCGLPTVATDRGRLIKTHEPWRPEYQKAIVLTRDGRDVAVSEFHFQSVYTKHFFLYGESFATFLDFFLQGKTNGYGAWQQHVTSWTSAASDRSNILLLPFEQLKEDTYGSLRSVCQHIGLDYSEQLLHDAIEDCSVGSMKAKEKAYWESKGESSRNFVRTGKAGGWKSHFTPELEERFWGAAGQAMETLGYQRTRLS